MADIFGIGISSSGCSVYAVIDATYPEGATCICSNGTHTIKAKDTSGHFLFGIPNSGEWTVTASSADQEPKSVTVSVTESKAYAIEITFKPLFYFAGNEYEGLTGGWKKSGTGGSLEKTALTMLVKTNTYQKNTNAITTNKIDLTNIATIVFDVESDTTYPTGYPRVGVTSKENPVADVSGDYSASTTLKEGRREVAVDISKLSGSYYVTAGGIHGDAGSNTITIYKVWGEPK